jgi:hypothetical protein
MAIDKTAKEAILKKLAKTDGDAANTALNKEADKIYNILSTSSDYETLSRNITYLELFAFRVPDRTVTIIKMFLERLPTLGLPYNDMEGVYSFRSAFTTEEKLISLSLKVIDHVVYYQPERVLSIAYSLITHENETLAKQARGIFVEYSKYIIQVFYGDGKTYGGLGTQPQEKVLEFIQALPPEDWVKNHTLIVEICTTVLSAEMSGTRWTYDKVIFSTGTLPPSDSVVAVRKTALSVLKKLFKQLKNPSDKKRVVGGLLSATYRPRSGEKQALIDLIIDDVVDVLNFLIEVFPQLELELVEALENDVYYIYQRLENPKSDAVALQLRKMFDAHEEYQVFKYLIGFEGIFTDWSRDSDDRDFEGERQLREGKAKEFAASISGNNYEEWRNRILSYSRIQSNDLATFPTFGKFLEFIGNSNPSIAMRLITEDGKQLERFLIALMVGVWKTESRDLLKSHIQHWLQQGDLLATITRFSGFMDPFDLTILSDAATKGLELKEPNTLFQIVGAVSNQVKSTSADIVNRFLVPAVQSLAEQDQPYWINDFWFRREKKEIFERMTDLSRQTILNSLLQLPSIGYEAEAVLTDLAKFNPVSVVEFFCSRLKRDKSGGEKYEPVPYEFHELAQQLSRIPKEAVDLVYETYDGNYGMFMFRGARLLCNIFPQLTPPFESELKRIALQKTEKDILFVLAILRGYDGDLSIYNLAKMLVQELPSNNDYENEIMIALESTGVVGGEFGFANAYKEKRDLIEPWLSDSNEKVRAFASKYSEMLTRQIEHEIKRAEESILLRKHEYGSDD